MNYNKIAKKPDNLMIKKIPEISNPKNIFNSNLFWDAEDIDIEQHAAYII